MYIFLGLIFEGKKSNNNKCQYLGVFVFLLNFIEYFFFLYLFLWQIATKLEYSIQFYYGYIYSIVNMKMTWAKKLIDKKGRHAIM